jgi:hypothetical protein
MVRPAMHNPVASGNQLLLADTGFDPADHLFEERGKVARSVHPTGVDQRRPVRVLRGEMRLRRDPLDLAA